MHARYSEQSHQTQNAINCAIGGGFSHRTLHTHTHTIALIFLMPKKAKTQPQTNQVTNHQQSSPFGLELEFYDEYALASTRGHCFGAGGLKGRRQE